MRVIFLFLSLFLLQIPPSLQLNCDGLTEADFGNWSQILEQCQNTKTLKYTGSGKQTLNADSIPWNRLWPLFNVATEIVGINLDFSSSEIADISLPYLQILEGDFIAQFCDNLQRINVPILKSVNSFLVNDNPRLTRLVLNTADPKTDTPKKMTGDLSISGNGMLQSFDVVLDENSKIETIIVSNNDKLTEATVRVKGDLHFTTFVLLSNPLLTKFDFKAPKFHWDQYKLDAECAEVKNSTMLLANPNCANFLVQNNERLKDLNFKKTDDSNNDVGYAQKEHVSGNMIFFVRNNPAISEESSSALYNLSRGLVGVTESAHDCHLTESVQNLKEIRRCKNILTDLTLSEEVKGSWPQKIENINGCIKINNTQLRSLSGLYNAKINCQAKNEISNNYHICDFEEPRIKTHLSTGGVLQEENNCGVMCSNLKDLFTVKKHKNCTYFLGDLKIHGLTVKKGLVMDDERDYGPVEQFSNLTKEIGKRLEFVWGSLEISNSRVPSIWYAFASLRAVYNLGHNTIRGNDSYSIKIFNSSLPSEKEDKSLYKLQSIASEEDSDRLEIAANRPKSRQDFLIEKVKSVSSMAPKKTVIVLEDTKKKSSNSTKRTKRSTEEDGNIKIIWVPEYEIEESSLDGDKNRLITTIVKYSLPFFITLMVASIVIFFVFYLSEEKPKN